MAVTRKAGRKTTDPTAQAIRLIRFRLQETQSEFAARFNTWPSAVARWETARVAPGIPNLLSLLNLSAIPEERNPIIDALKSRGIDDAIANFLRYFSPSPGNAPVPLGDSIARPTEGGNVQIS
jgi:transcriptional regulator with XRE-family HTH domain